MFGPMRVVSKRISSFVVGINYNSNWHGTTVCLYKFFCFFDLSWCIIPKFTSTNTERACTNVDACQLSAVLLLCWLPIPFYMAVRAVAVDLRALKLCWFSGSRLLDSKNSVNWLHTTFSKSLSFARFFLTCKLKVTYYLPRVLFAPFEIFWKFAV